MHNFTLSMEIIKFMLDLSNHLKMRNTVNNIQIKDRPSEKRETRYNHKKDVKDYIYNSFCTCGLKLSHSLISHCSWNKVSDIFYVLIHYFYF